jgi:3-hydroxyisobutyrate dehydrogenase
MMGPVEEGVGAMEGRPKAMDPADVTVGFIGLGNMGRNMARHLMDAGYRLVVHDLQEEAARPFVERGARWAPTVSRLAGSATIVFTALPEPRDVAAVALGPEGILENLPRGGVFVDLSTNSPTVIREIYARGGELGIDVLDATMAGGMHGAVTRHLSLIVGGDRPVLERCLPLLESMSDNVMYAGASGSGAVVKIVNNMIALCASILVGDALIIGAKAGVDLATLTDIIGKSSGATWRMNESFPRYLLKGDFEPGFALDLAVKDLRLAAELAGEEGIRSDCLELFHEKYVEAQSRGWGRLHSEAVVRLAEEKAGVELRLSPPDGR